MLKLHLFLYTISISVERRWPTSFAQKYEDDLRIQRLIEENEKKRDKMHLW